MEDEDVIIHRESTDYQELPFCKCICDDTQSIVKTPSEEIQISERKQFILSTVARTENYLRERRIPELIRFLLTMVLAHLPEKPVDFLERLLDDCMLFRAGHGVAPVLYETRHLEAVLKSFDPSNRGCLSAGQVYRLCATLGLNMEEMTEEKISCEVLLSILKKTQDSELYELLVAGANLNT